MNDITDVGAIKVVVDNFYNKVRTDELLGPVFGIAINGDWQPHLDKMYAFWNAALFGVAGFKGNPFAKHAPLFINANHFNRWLQLFNETVDSHFTGNMAVEAKNRAHLMSDMFQSKLSNMRGGADKVIV